MTQNLKDILNSTLKNEEDKIFCQQQGPMDMK